MASFDKSKVDRSLRVLYIEDEADIRENMLDILELFVDKLYVASNGREGLEVYRDKHPDLIITDIQMPLMSGLDMMREIRKIDEHIPIMITSAFNDSSYLLEAISLGVEHFLMKPIGLTHLEMKLKKLHKHLIQERELEVYRNYLETRVEEEVALRQAEEKLLIRQNKDAELGQMVSIIAHQWKQPLHYLNMLIEDLAYEYEEGLSQEFINTFVQKGMDRIDFLSKTMDNFLRFYKSDYEIKVFDVVASIKQIQFFLQPLFDAFGVKIELEFECELSLKGSENEFQQVVMNLLNNSKEAFRDLKKREAFIKVLVSKTKENKPYIKICDNAGGIDPKIIENIFTMEYTTKSDGNGIGLYLVDKIVRENFLGSIDVTNKEGGVCFTLVFDKVDV